MFFPFSLGVIMRHFLLSLIFAMLAAVASAGEMRIVNSPGDGFLNLRSGPGSSFQILQPMLHGSMVEILEVSGAWSRVRHEDSGAEGWAFSKYLVPFDGGAPMKFVHSPGDGYLNLRTGPGTGFAVVRRMFNGEAVEIVERKGDWVRVYHQSGETGWCSSRYLRD